MGVIGLVLLLVGGVVGAGVLLTGGGPTHGTDAVAVPEAVAARPRRPRAGARRARPPTPRCPTRPPSPASSPRCSPRRPSAAASRPQVVDVATGQVLLDLDAADPATPASTAKLLTAAGRADHARPDRHPDHDGRRRQPPRARSCSSAAATRRCPAPRRRRPTRARPPSPTSPPRCVAALPAGTPVTRRRRRQLAVHRPADRRRLGRRPTPRPATPPRSPRPPSTAPGSSPGSTARSGQPGIDAGPRPGRRARRPRRDRRPGRGPGRRPRRWRTVAVRADRPAGRAGALDVGQHARRGARPGRWRIARDLPGQLRGRRAGGHRRARPTPGSTSPASTLVRRQRALPGRPRAGRAC